MQHILIDAREFTFGKRTGISQVLEGLVDALAESSITKKILLATPSIKGIPEKLKNRKDIEACKIPASFIASEKALSNLTKKDVKLFISTYPKLPLFGSSCISINTVHDILYLTHPAYKKRFKAFIDTIRLKKDLIEADLTWYVSEFSLKETKKLIGIAGRTARVRYPGIDNKFTIQKAQNESDVVKKNNLMPGYILVIGNGLPHKNLGVLLKVSGRIARKLVLLGVSYEKQNYWRRLYPNAQAVWIDYVVDKELPSLMRNSFCLAQPSTAEGFGYPPLEAMACGVPAVVSGIPVLIETTGGYAVTADPHEPSSWLNAFENLENKEFYNKQIIAGLKWVKPFQGKSGFTHYISDIEDLIQSNSGIIKQS